MPPPTPEAVFPETVLLWMSSSLAPPREDPPEKETPPPSPGYWELAVAWLLSMRHWSRTALLSPRTSPPS